MELFPATDLEQLVYIKKVIDECDYYIIIMGGRYGSFDAEGISFTEREYDYAVATGKFVIAFPHGNLDNLPIIKSDTAPAMQESLTKFRKKVMTGRLVREWTSREQLEALVVKSLVRATSDYPALGWIRGNAVASEDILQQINELREKNARLLEERDKLSKDQYPIIPELAGLDDTVLVRSNWYSYADERVISNVHSLSWRQILKAIGQILSVPTPRAALKSTLSKYLQENDGNDPAASIFESDADLIQNQLEALGLLELTSLSSGKGSPVAMLSLTAQGRAELMRSLAVTTPKASQNA